MDGKDHLSINKVKKFNSYEINQRLKLKSANFGNFNFLNEVGCEV